MRISRLVAAFILLALLTPARADKPRTDLYGDPLPEGVLARLGTVRLRPGESVFQVAVAPDGKSLATAEGLTLRFWDLATGKETRTVPITSAVGIHHVAYSPDGKYCLVHSNLRGPVWFGGLHPRTESLHLVESATGKVREIRQEDVCYGQPRFLPDSEALVAMRDKPDQPQFVAWDVKTGKVRDTFHCGRGWAVAAPDGRRLARGTPRGKVVLVDVKTRREQVLGRHKQAVSALTFSPDGKLLASGSGLSVLFDRNAPGDTAVRLWDTTTGKLLGRCAGHGDRVMELAFSADGKTLVSRDESNHLLAWDTATLKKRWHRPGNRQEDQPFLLLDATTVVYGTADGTVCEVGLADGKERRRWQAAAAVQQLAVTPDGKTLLAVAGSLHVWDRDRGKEKHTFAAHRVPVGALEFSADGKTLASLDWSGRLRLWQPRTGQPLAAPEATCLHFGFLDGDDRLAALGADGALRLYEVPGGRLVYQRRVCLAPTRTEEYREDEKRAATVFASIPRFGPGHRVLVVADGRQRLDVWDVAAGKKLDTLEGTYDDKSTTAAFSPDGRFLAAVSDNAPLRLWELPACKKLAEIRDWQSAAFLPNGKALAWNLGDRVRFVELPSARPTHRIEAGSDLGRFAFEDDGRLLLGAVKDCTAEAWETANGRLRRTEQFPERDVSFVAGPGGVLIRACDGGKSQRCAYRDWATGRTLVEIGTGTKLVFSPDGRLAATNRGRLPLIETASGGQVGGIRPDKLRGWTHCLTFSPDGSLLAAGFDDTTVLVWEVRQLCPAAAAQASKPDALWETLGARDASLAWRALDGLARRGPEAVRLIRQKVKPVTRERWQAWERLLAALNSEKAAVREEAHKELAVDGDEAQALLVRALGRGLSAEAADRVETILRSPPDDQFLRRLRAVQVLERIGTPEARALLESFTKGAVGARLTEEAKAALERLARRPAAPP